MKRISIAVVLILAGSWGVGYAVVGLRQDKQPSVFDMTKAQYVDIATKNCVKDGQPESYCRCYYTEYLRTNTVKQAFEFDTAVSANPDYEPTKEQYDLLIKCAGEAEWRN